MVNQGELRELINQDSKQPWACSLSLFCLVSLSDLDNLPSHPGRVVGVTKAQHRKVHHSHLMVSLAL